MKSRILSLMSNHEDIVMNGYEEEVEIVYALSIRL